MHRMLAIILVAIGLPTACVHNTYDNLLDVHEEAGQLGLILILAAGLSPQARPGYSWRQVTTNAGFPARSYPLVLVFQNRLWVIGGFDQNGDLLTDVWSSPDGIAWTRATNTLPVAAAGTRLPGVVFGGRMWIFDHVTNTTDVYASTDGVTWTLMSTIASTFGEGKTLVFDGRMRFSEADGIIVSFDSTDGVNWSQYEVVSGLSTGSLNDTFMYNGRLNYSYGTKIGLRDAKNKFATVATLAYSPARMLSYNQVFWAFGSEVLTSTDGVAWFGATALNLYCCRAPELLQRIQYDITVFQNRLWLIGGIDAAGEVRSDVWQSVGAGVGQDGEARSDGSG